MGFLFSILPSIARLFYSILPSFASGVPAGDTAKTEETAVSVAIRRGSRERRDNFLFVDVEELFLVRPDLVDVDVVVARVEVLLEVLDVVVGVGTAEVGLLDVFLGDGLCGFLEVGRRR